MFKNEIIITQSYVLSKQEKKEIAKILTKSYDAKHVDYVFKNFQNLSFHKNSANKKRILFSDNTPIFFEFDLDVFYPTVYLLNMLPNFMQEKKCYIYDQTDSFLSNGADLMLKGIINRDEIKKNTKFRLNDIFCVETLSGTITMIGETLMSWNIMNPNNPAGKFLKNVHRIDDSLWNLGNKKIPKKIIVPELEKINKLQIQSDKENIAKLSLEREEAKKLLNLELIQQVNKLKLETEFDIEKLNSIFEDEEKFNYDDIFDNTNLIAILDNLLKEKIEKIENNENAKNNLEEIGNYKILNKNFNENYKQEQEKENNNSNDNSDNLEEQDGNSENNENSEDYSEENFERNNKYFNSENLEYIQEKLNKFNSYYEYLEEEIKKYIEAKTTPSANLEEKKDNNTNQDLENKNNETQNENANKKVKQHKKNHKNKKEKQPNDCELIDISVITNNIGNEESENIKNEISEAEIKTLKNDFLKTNLNLDLDYKTLKQFKFQLAKLNEFILFTLILTKSKSDANFMADPKFLSLLTTYKSILEAAEKSKEEISADNNTNNADNLNSENQNLEKEEIDETEILLSKMSPEEMDENINLVFLTVLKLIILPKKDEIFPLDPGKLLKDFLKPMANELEVLFDFKYSSHKKINNYLKNLAKNEEFIVFAKPKGMQNDYILSVNWQSDKLKNFVPPIKKVNFILNKPVNKDDERENVILNKDEKIELTQMFKPNSQIADIFKRMEKEHASTTFYPITKCNEVLTNYLKVNNLFCKGTGEVSINQELKEKIFKKTEKKIGEKLKMDEMLLLWRKNLNEKDIITKTSGESTEVFKTTKGNTTCKIRIVARKLFNKNVTLVDGLNFFVDLKDITKTFSKHFACSVTVKPYQNSENMVFIQGYWVNELLDILQNELKLGKNFIVVEDKLKLKKK